MRGLWASAAIGMLMATGPAFAAKAPPQAAVPEINANVALSSFMALSDDHLQKMADSLKLLALDDAVQTGDWEKIRVPLQHAAKLNVEAVNWFARPDGEYWTVQQGHSSEKLSDRPYFKKLLDGKVVLGDLVVSRSTGKSIAVVAVPILAKDGKIIGALGASVYLDKLSDRLRRELGVSGSMIYYSFNDKPLVGINWDPTLIFTDPQELGPDVSQAFDKMLKNKEGTVSYRFRGKVRTVAFKKSEVTGWWYAFGVIEG